jgi:hypothetical protein
MRMRLWVACVTLTVDALRHKPKHAVLVTACPLVYASADEAQINDKGQCNGKQYE